MRIGSQDRILRIEGAIGRIEKTDMHILQDKESISCFRSINWSLPFLKNTFLAAENNSRPPSLVDACLVCTLPTYPPLPITVGSLNIASRD